MKVLLIDNGTTLLPQLRALIPGGETVRSAETFDPVEAATFDVVILSGSSAIPLHGNEAAYEAELAFVRETTKPLIGICFGAQVIAAAFGASLKEMPQRHKGINEIALVKEGREVANAAKLRVYENHRWIMESVPEGFVVLARSADGPELIRHSTRPIWGMQFHPEHMVDKAEGDELFLTVFDSLMTPS